MLLELQGKGLARLMLMSIVVYEREEEEDARIAKGYLAGRVQIHGSRAVTKGWSSGSQGGMRSTAWCCRVEDRMRVARGTGSLNVGQKVSLKDVFALLVFLRRFLRELIFPA